MLSCRRKDDILRQVPADEGLAHESQSSETVIDDIMTDVNVLGMEDVRVKARLTEKSTRIASWIQMRKEILEINVFRDSATCQKKIIMCMCRDQDNDEVGCG